MEIQLHGVEEAFNKALCEGVRVRMTGSYDNPVAKVIDQSVKANEAVLRGILDEAVAACAGCAEFRAAVRQAVRESLAKMLVKRFGGELEKQVNVLKSDPATRARITLAIEQIAAGKAA